MSECLKHEPCPRCRDRGSDRSGNNLGVYSDHLYCFSCGYWKSTKSGFQTLESVQKEEKQNASDSLPNDFSINIRVDALAWIKQYGITQKELDKNHIGWSDEKEFLIFPVLDMEGGLIMWQGRYFGTNQKFPKYITKGYKRDVYHVLGSGNPCVLVEDLISAIKVSRVTSAMPLWGSSILSKQCFILSRRFESLTIWLDPDKYNEAIKFSNRAGLFFNEVHVVLSEKDPKEHSDEEIKAYLRMAK